MKKSTLMLAIMTIISFSAEAASYSGGGSRSSGFSGSRSYSSPSRSYSSPKPAPSAPKPAPSAQKQTSSLQNKNSTQNLKQSSTSNMWMWYWVIASNNTGHYEKIDCSLPENKIKCADKSRLKPIQTQ